MKVRETYNSRMHIRGTGNPPDMTTVPEEEVVEEVPLVMAGQAMRLLQIQPQAKRNKGMANWFDINQQMVR